MAQEVRVPGYIVKINNDTLHGFIKDHRDNWRVSEIEFSSSQNSSSETYAVVPLQSFYLEPYNALYRRVTMEIDKKPIDMTHLEPFADRRMVLDTILIELIVKGPLNLYRYEDEKAKIHFFAEKGGELTELPYARFLTPKGVVNVKTFRHTLNMMTSDCAKGLDAPADYTFSLLSSFVRKYNECVTGKKSEKRAASLRLSAGVFAGAGISQVNITAGNDPDGARYSGSFGNSNSFMGGFRLELVSKRAANRNRIGLMMLYSTYSKVNKEIVTGAIKRNYSLDFTTLQVGFTYRYLFKSPRMLIPYVQLEADVVYIARENAKLELTDALGTVHNGHFLDFQKIGLGAAPAIGVLFRDRLSLELKYKLLPMNSSVSSKINITGPEISLGYTVSK